MPIGIRKAKLISRKLQRFQAYQFMRKIPTLKPVDTSGSRKNLAEFFRYNLPHFKPRGSIIKRSPTGAHILSVFGLFSIPSVDMMQVVIYEQSSKIFSGEFFRVGYFCFERYAAFQNNYSELLMKRVMDGSQTGQQSESIKKAMTMEGIRGDQHAHSFRDNHYTISGNLFAQTFPLSEEAWQLDTERVVQPKEFRIHSTQIKEHLTHHDINLQVGRGFLNWLKMSRQIYYAKLVLCVSVITLTQSPPAVGQQRLPAKCTLPILSGYGTASYRKYGFDGQKCVPFIYAGTGGNANRFSTEAECQRECESKAATQTTMSTTIGPNIIAKCTLPILSGYGTANYRRYGFDGQRCIPFTYTGAGGNANRFSTEAECRRECGGEAVTVATQTTLSTTPIPYTIDKCTLPIRSGFGTFNYERYGFDGRRCVPFTYTGAGGNANNFFSEAACRRECENKVVTQAKPTPTPVTPKSNTFGEYFCQRIPFVEAQNGLHVGDE
ncbi:papilin [Clonorchis sinensis]|uniref:Papilin n=1 Tax=Clonorchis sinensis TaxID=79923 RepID=H2KS33_CLOSI|nr:papilin [Clonorchis sinensis]